MFTNLVKTGFEVKRKTADSKKEAQYYTWAPPTFKKFGEFVRWVQYRPYHEALANDLPQNIVDEILTECRKGMVTEKVPPDDWDFGTKEKPNLIKEADLVEKSFDINMTSSVVVEYLTHPEGLAKLLQLGISINHPEVTESLLDKDVDFSEQVLVLAEMQSLMFGSPEAVESEEPAKNEESPNQ